MSRITRIVLAALVVLGSVTLAQAQYRGAHSYQSRDVSSQQGWGSAREAWMDRASRSYSGGGY